LHLEANTKPHVAINLRFFGQILHLQYHAQTPKTEQKMDFVL
jgi:hypothetical protein